MAILFLRFSLFETNLEKQLPYCFLLNQTEMRIGKRKGKENDKHNEIITANPSAQAGVYVNRKRFIVCN
jgi:hypothetical protein